MAGYIFGKAPRDTRYYDYFKYDDSSTTSDTTASEINRNRQKFRVDHQMTYKWDPDIKEVEIKRPTKVFTEYIQDLGLTPEFYERMKSDILKLREGKLVEEMQKIKPSEVDPRFQKNYYERMKHDPKFFLQQMMGIDKPKKETEEKHEALIFDPENLDI